MGGLKTTPLPHSPWTATWSNTEIGQSHIVEAYVLISRDNIGQTLIVGPYDVLQVVSLDSKRPYHVTVYVM